MGLPKSISTLEDGNLGRKANEGIDRVCLIVGVAQDGSVLIDITPKAGNTSDGEIEFHTSNVPKVDALGVIKIIDGGECGAATFKYSLDNGITWSQKITTPATGTSIQLGTTGIILVFTSGTDPDFVANDQWTFKTEGCAEANKIYTVTKENYKEIFKSGELVEYLEEFFNTEIQGYGYPAKAKAIRPVNDVAGSITDVTYGTTNTGTGVLDVSTSAPLRDMDIEIEIVETEGACGTAKFRYRIDNGNWSDPITTPATGEMVYLGYGVFVEFTNGLTANNSWKLGDTFTFTAFGKTATDYFTALQQDEVKHDGSFSYIISLQEKDLTGWRAMTQILDNIKTEGYPVWAGMPVERRTSETVSQWVTGLINQGKLFFDKRIALFTSLVNTITEKKLSSIIYAAALCSVEPVNVSLGRVATNNLSRIASIVDENALKPYLETLADERFTVVMTHPAIDGYYFGNDYVFSPAGSDYRYIEDIRTAMKCQRLIQYKGTLLLKSDFTANNGVLKAISEDIRSFVLNSMTGEITSLDIEVKSTMESLKLDGVLKLGAVIDSRVTIDEVQATVGYKL